MNYSLVEIFESLQGEGRNTGRPVVFVRFAGCNLSCPWCDTEVAKRFELSLDDLVAEVKTHRAKSVILTGGEPTIQKGMDELVAALKAEGYWIGVETNGTNEPAWFAAVDYVACSPKAEYPERIRLTKANEVRLVASCRTVGASPTGAEPQTEKDFLAFARRVRTQIAATDYYISPCERDGEIDFATAKSVLSTLDGFSLSVQLHKILGFR